MTCQDHTALARWFGLAGHAEPIQLFARTNTNRLRPHDSPLSCTLRMEPMVGIEPTTYGLRNRCSTAELHWLFTLKQTKRRLFCLGPNEWQVNSPFLTAAGDLLWLRQAGGTSDDESFRVVVDSNANAFIAGVFSGTATVGGTTLTSAWDYDIFVAKYDTAGSPLWAVRGGGNSRESALDIAVDPSGNCFLTGGYTNDSAVMLWRHLQKKRIGRKPRTHSRRMR